MSKTTIRKGKQDDRFSLAIRDIQSKDPANKKCFDCEQRGPTYVNITIGSFVCSKCSGMLRGINPPHRMKSISMCSFTNDDVDMMRVKGNAWCNAVWLGTYQKSTMPIDYKDDEKIKEFMIAKYEKRRYYVDPSQANLPNKSPSGFGTSSAQKNTPLENNSPHPKLSSSSLIGSTLKARVDPNSCANISVSRPISTTISPLVSSSRQINIHEISGKGSPIPSSNGQSIAPDPPKNNSQSDQFADFANFDTAAFDSLPADPLFFPPSSTLPPVNKKPSNELPSSMVTSTAKKSEPAVDRYSALKELDDLFKSTTIQSPGPEINPAKDLFASSTQEATVFSQNTEPSGFANRQETNIFSTSNASAIPVFGVTSSHDVFGISSPPQNGGPVWGRMSPAVSSQWAPASQTRSTPPVWGRDSLWANHEPSTSNIGWADSSHKQLGPPGNSQTTNPFGTSPSNQQHSQFFATDNNNDLFAAAPKPLISDKPGFLEQGDNPWNSVSAFTANMTPAPNPNNPFL